MEKTVQIKYTETFDNLANNVIDHLASYSDEEHALNRVELFIERFENLISFTPNAAPISQSLLELGVTTFREFTADGFRLLYRIIETDHTTIIQCDAILTQRQDIQQTLINYCLIYK